VVCATIIEASDDGWIEIIVEMGVTSSRRKTQ